MFPLYTSSPSQSSVVEWKDVYSGNIKSFFDVLTQSDLFLWVEFRWMSFFFFNGFKNSYSYLFLFLESYMLTDPNPIYHVT